MTSHLRIRYPNGDNFMCYQRGVHLECENCVETVKVMAVDIPYPATNRVKNTYYRREGQLVWWDGSVIRCEHKKRPSRCEVCLLRAPINKSNRLCSTEGCFTNASYGLEGGKARFCIEHCDTGMVDLISNKCESCTVQACFGFEGGKPRFCIAHSEPGMVNLRNAKCERCDKTPCFGLEGQKARFCVDHMETGMVNVKCVKCEKCGRQPSFGFEGQKARFCVNHCEVGMINVKCVKCEKCDRQPSYGTPSLHPNHCSSHKVLGDIRNPRANCSHPNCSHPNCSELALFGTSSPTHCTNHQMSDQLDLVQRQCISCPNIDTLDRNSHCSACDPSFFERFRLAKQKMVKAHHDANDLAYSSYDKILNRGIFGLERPDFVYNNLHQEVVGEVDEHQHGRGRYSKQHDQNRMTNITKSLGKKTLFVRFNPDKYKPLQGEQASIKERLDQYDKMIRYWCEHPVELEGQTFVIYMYYDDDDPKQWYLPQVVM